MKSPKCLFLAQQLNIPFFTRGKEEPIPHYQSTVYTYLLLPLKSNEQISELKDTMSKMYYEVENPFHVWVFDFLKPFWEKETVLCLLYVHNNNFIIL